MKPSLIIDAACNVMGFSRQAYYRKQVERPSSLEALQQILPQVRAIREQSPSKGCRAIYERYGHNWSLGRDLSISLLMDAGYGVGRRKSYRRATQSGCRLFDNLLVNKQVSAINQVWQADMSYYLYGQKPYYTIYITDVYNQEIVGYGAYETNHAVNYAEVLNRALSSQQTDLSQLIHHSDGGKQYESIIYRSICEKFGVRQSMCMFSYENPYAEKTNDLINNGYLSYWKPYSLRQLRRMQAKAVKDHNKNSRKKVLGKKSPGEFNNWLKMTKHEGAYTLLLKPENPTQPRNKILC